MMIVLKCFNFASELQLLKNITVIHIATGELGKHSKALVKW